MNALVGWMAGWGAGVAPAVLIGALAIVDDQGAAYPLAFVATASALTFGLAGSFAGLVTRTTIDGSAVPRAIALAAEPAGILAFLALPVVFLSEAPLLSLGGIVALFLPPPIAAASTAWLLTRETHGTS